MDSISDKENWGVGDLGIIDPKQFLLISELLDSMMVYGLQSQLVDEAFFTFAIEEEQGGQVKLSRVRDSLLKAEDVLFNTRGVLDEEKGPYADFLNHVTQIRVSMLNELIEFAEPYTQEEMEEVLAEKQNNDFLGGQRSHFGDELFAILDFVPEGFAIDSDLEEDPDTAKDKTEDYSDLETGLEVTEKEEKLLPDEDLKWEEEEKEETISI